MAPPPRASPPFPQVPKAGGGCRRCHLAPPSSYMDPVPSPAHYPQSALPETHSHSSPAPAPQTQDMSSSCSPLQLQGSGPFPFDCDGLLKQTYDGSSDAGYFSCCSSLSPTSSVDSFCFSPTAFPCGATGADPLDCFVFGGPAPRVEEERRTPAVQGTAGRKSRSRYPGKKRQTASEREKLRMRDLTKALHHLRGYLPPSVVPAGQTLTKIETLRLTIRYISYLSAQLGQDALAQRSPGAVDQTQNQTQNQNQAQDQYQAQYQTQYQDQTQYQEQYQSQHQTQSSTAAHYSPQQPCYNMEEETPSYLQSPPALHFSLPQAYQIPSDVCYAAQPATQDYWTPQDHMMDLFSGLC